MPPCLATEIKSWYRFKVSGGTCDFEEGYFAFSYDNRVDGKAFIKRCDRGESRVRATEYYGCAGRKYLKGAGDLVDRPAIEGMTIKSYERGAESARYLKYVG